MTNERILIGVSVAALCAFGLLKQRWMLDETPKGRRLVAWLGEPRAHWTVRVLLAIGIAFGTLLACGVIRPVEW